MEKKYKKINFLTIAIIMVLTIWAISGFVIYLLSDYWGDRGTMGDMFGVVNALYSGLAFAALLYTIILQREEIKMNRSEIALNRKELAKSVNLKSPQMNLIL